MEVEGFVCYVEDSKGKRCLGKNFGRGGAGHQIWVSESSLVADWGWKSKNGGLKTSYGATAVITIFALKYNPGIWMCWGLRDFQSFYNAGSQRLLDPLCPAFHRASFTLVPFLLNMFEHTTMGF